MIIDRLATRELDVEVERSARVRWNGGEATARFTVPAGSQTSDDDGSPYLAALLLLAMRRRERLEIDAHVSPRLMAALEELQSAFQAYDPWLLRSPVRAAGDAYAGTGDGVACFFSRGVDSVTAAALPRRPPFAYSQLVVCDDFAGTVRDAGEEVKREEARLRAEVSERLGLPLVTVGCNVKTLTDELFNWGDAHGAALASIALSLAGSLRRAVIPSSDTYVTVGAWGSGPMIDPLFSTETVELEPDSIMRGRVAKVGWLAKERPDLLPYLQVCFRGRRTDNCGRCIKCLMTMIGLRLAGVELEGLPFPPEIDPEAIVRLPPDRPQALIGWADLCHRLEPEGEQGEIRSAILRALHRWARPPLRERLRARVGAGSRASTGAPPVRPTFGHLHAERALTVLARGEPWPPLEGAPPA